MMKRDISLLVAFVLAIAGLSVQAASYNITVNVSMTGGDLSDPDGMTVTIVDGASSVVDTGVVSGDTVVLSVSATGNYTVELALASYSISIVTPTDGDVSITSDTVVPVVATATLITSAGYSIAGSLTVTGELTNYALLQNLVFVLTDGTGNTVATALLGMYGSFSFSDVPNGTYFFKATLTGYTIVEAPATITVNGCDLTGQIINLDFAVVKDDPKDENDCALSDRRTSASAAWSLLALAVGAVAFGKRRAS